ERVPVEVTVVRREPLREAFERLLEATPERRARNTSRFESLEPPVESGHISEVCRRTDLELVESAKNLESRSHDRLLGDGRAKPVEPRLDKRSELDAPAVIGLEAGELTLPVVAETLRYLDRVFERVGLGRALGA